MRLLLDTCTFLWLAEGGPELSARSRTLISARENELYLSSVSVWEIVVKHSLRRLQLKEPPEVLVPNYRELHSIEPLPLDEESVLQLKHLPNRHRDPFDRMLICQAIAGAMAILTPDPEISQYPVRTIW